MPALRIPNRLRRLAWLPGLIAAAVQLQSAHAADGSLSAQGGGGWVGNPGHALDAGSRSSDQRIDAALQGEWHFYPSDFDTLSLGAGLDTARFQRHPGLDVLSLAPRLALLHRTGLGARHPWWRVAAGGGHAWYRDGIRSGWRFDAEVGAGVRIDARWDISAALLAQRRTQDHALADGPDLPGTVYAQGHQGVRADSRWVLAPAWTLQAGVVWLRGDFDAVHQQDLDQYAGVSAYADDPSFGPAGYGYRFRAISRTLTLVASRALGAHASLNLVVERSATAAAQGGSYVDPQILVLYAWRS